MALENVQSRINLWLNNHVNLLLQPLVDLSGSEELDGIAKGLAFQLVENLGILDRRTVSEDVRSLDQDARASLRKFGVRFGAYHIYVPVLLKPAPSSMLVMMWALHNGGLDQEGIVEVPSLSASGRTSIPVNEAISASLYKTVGFGVYGKRAVRIDILERLADLIRPLLSWRATEEAPVPPEGVMERGFTVTVAMTSLLGCAGEDFSTILKSLGYRVERRKIEPTPASDAPDSSVEPADEAQISEQPDATKVAETSEAVVVDATSPQEDVRSEGDTETDAVAASSEAVEEEEKWLEIWRPGGRGDRKPNRSGNRNKPASKDAPAKSGGRQSPRSERGYKGSNRSGNEGGNKNANRQRTNEKARGKPRDQTPRKPQKVADPDSPFAALAALKASLDKGK